MILRKDVCSLLKLKCLQRKFIADEDDGWIKGIKLSKQMIFLNRCLFALNFIVPFQKKKVRKRCEIKVIQVKNKKSLEK